MSSTFAFSLILLVLAIAGVCCDIPFVSNYAFWIAIAAYIIRDWTLRTLIWTGVLSLIVLMLVIVGVFVFIPVVSHYAFWVAIAAYIIRLLVGIPRVVPDRIGLVHVS